MTPASLVAVNLPSVIDEAVRSAVAKVGERDVAIISEYPAHLPAVRAESAGLVSAVEAPVGLAGSWVAQGEVRVRAELAAGEGLSGVPAAAVSVQVAAAHVTPQAAHRLQQAAAVQSRVDEAWPEIADTCALTESWGGGLTAQWRAEQGAELRLTLPLWAARELAPGVQAVQRAVETRLSSLDPGNLGVVLAFDIGDKKQAVKELEEYLKLAPNAPDANQLRQEIARLKATP